MALGILILKLRIIASKVGPPSAPNEVQEGSGTDAKKAPQFSADVFSNGSKAPTSN